MLNCRRNTPQRNGLRFPRSHRLTRENEIKRVTVQGKRIRTDHLEVRALASPLLHPRVGFIVPKFGHSAVERNKLKRRLREIVRTRFLGTLPVVDVVIKARPETYAIQVSILTDELQQLVQAVTILAL